MFLTATQVKCINRNLLESNPLTNDKEGLCLVPLVLRISPCSCPLGFASDLFLFLSDVLCGPFQFSRTKRPLK